MSTYMSKHRHLGWTTRRSSVPPCAATAASLKSLHMPSCICLTCVDTAHVKHTSARMLVRMSTHMSGTHVYATAERERRSERARRYTRPCERSELPSSVCLLGMCVWHAWLPSLMAKSFRSSPSLRPRAVNSRPRRIASAITQ